MTTNDKVNITIPSVCYNQKGNRRASEVAHELQLVVGDLALFMTMDDGDPETRNRLPGRLCGFAPDAMFDFVGRINQLVGELCEAYSLHHS